MTIDIDAFGMSRKGQNRPANEDQFLIGTLAKKVTLDQTTLDEPLGRDLVRSSPGRILLVADGVGGKAAGDRASSLAAKAAVRHVVHAMPWFLSLSIGHQEGCEDDLRRTFHQSNQAVLEAGGDEPGQSGMATTLTLAWLVWPRCYVVHVGDSRCYLHREGALRQVTQDHTLGAALQEHGPVDVSEHLAHALTNVVGGDSRSVKPEVTRLDLEPGDLLLLCTDGLTRDLNDEEIARVLEADSNAEGTCSSLLTAARREGEAADDTTVVVVRSSGTATQSLRKRPLLRAV